MRRRRRAEAAAGRNNNVDDHDHEEAEPEIDANAASRGTMLKPNSKHAVAAAPPACVTSPRPWLAPCLALTSNEPYVTESSRMTRRRRSLESGTAGRSLEYLPRAWRRVPRTGDRNPYRGLTYPFFEQRWLRKLWSTATAWMRKVFLSSYVTPHSD